MGVHRDRGEADAGRPALGSPGEALERLRRQRDSMLRQEQAGFGAAESEVAGPDLGQLASQPVAMQRQQRVHARRSHQSQPRVPQHVVKPAQHLGVGQQMKVVDDQRHRRVRGGQRRRQPQQELVVGCLPRPGGRQGPRNGHAGPAQCRDDIRPEDPRTVVVVIETDPGHRAWARRRPQRHSHRLARAGRAGDNSQPAPRCVLANQLADPRARNGPARHARRGDLSGQNRIADGGDLPSGAGRRPVSQVSRHRELPALSAPAS